VLPFGGRSSPFIFNTLADALLWVAQEFYNVRGAVHYLDGYFFATANSQACSGVMTGFKGMCRDLNVPLTVDKTEGPAQCITFLGIEIDSANMICQLPNKKLSELHEIL